jgi:hypothetical protein
VVDNGDAGRRVPGRLVYRLDNRERMNTIHAIVLITLALFAGIGIGLVIAERKR